MGTEMDWILEDETPELKRAIGMPLKEQQMNSGLDCDYYDFPENIHCAQDMIEWLNLNFANGNILKSLIRESGAETKETDSLYEAEKRYFFAGRELERVRNLPKREKARGCMSNGIKEESK